MKEISFKKINEDARGKIYQIKFGDNEFVIVTFGKGALRGGHYHSHDKFHVVLDGKFSYRELDLETKEKRKREVKSGDVINVKAGIVHIFEAIEDGMILEPEDGERAINYQPWRQEVENFLKKHEDS